MSDSRSSRIPYTIGLIAIAGLAAVWLFTRVLPGPSRASKIIIKAANADATQSYIADVNTETWYRNKLVKVTSKVYHLPKGERTEYYRGHLAGVVVVDDESHTYTWKTGSSSVETTETPTLSRQQRPALLLRNYSPSLHGQDYVGGRLCHIIELTPKKRGPFKRLWIDKSTYIALRIEDLDAMGRLTSSSAFSNVKYVGSLPASLLRPPTKAKARSEPSNLSSLSKRLGFRARTPRYVPAGYVLLGCRLNKCACECGHESAQLVYTNGVDTISVFQAARPQNCGMSGKCGLHNMNPGGVCLAGGDNRIGVAVARRGTKSVVVVGALGMNELMRIARSTP